MRALTQSRPESENAASGAAGLRLIPRPRTLGVFAILVMLLAFTAGWLRNELALMLLGTVFFAVLAYSFLGIFFLGLLHRRKAGTLSMVIAPESVEAGKETGLYIKTAAPQAGKIRLLRLPAILVRCELFLQTRDGRVIRHFAEPGMEDYSLFPVKERGAYFSGVRPGEGEHLVIFDAPGFFRLSFPVGGNETRRLLALPAPAGELIRFSLRSGGSEQRNEPHYRKSDELTSHRPYIPGDDPRRINWKLYGHAPQGELFVREGEPEPPPRSRLLILIDTEADRSLYTLDEARRAVDLLCENALSAAMELSGEGMDILIGWGGGGIMGGKDGGAPLNAAEFASVLAWPAAVLRPALSAESRTNGELPAAPGDRGALVLALPRSNSETSALDRFLKNRGNRQGTDIVFLYGAEGKEAAGLRESAGVCVNLYNGKPGVHAGMAAVSPNGNAR